MRPWAAARPLAVRAASCARRVGSKPGQAPPPPTGTAAWPLKPLRRPPLRWCCVAGVWLGASSRSLARPCRRPRAPRPGPAFCSSPVPSGPSGALRTSGTWCAGVWLGALACCLARPCRSLWASRGSRVLSFWGALVCVVTNVVNLRAFSLKMVVFGLRLTTFVTGVLVRRFELRWFDDVCNVGRPLVARPGPAAAARPCRQVAWLSETAVAFARLYLWGIETAITFAGTGRASTETAIAFAGEKWAFLARFWVALVSSVSMVAVQGRALVMVVSRWPVSVVVEVSLVASSPRGCVLCAKKFALRGLVVGVSAKKFALHAQNTPKSAFLRLQGELFRGWGVGGGVLGELFRGWGVGGGVPGELFRAC